MLEIDKSTLKVVIYGRISARKQEENLSRQVERLRQYCKEKGCKNIIEFVEIASGLNDKRRQFHKMIDAVIRKEVHLIVVEHKDRLSRFGLRLIYHFFEGLGCKIEIIETELSKDENKELVDDMLAFITFFQPDFMASVAGERN